MRIRINYVKQPCLSSQTTKLKIRIDERKDGMYSKIHHSLLKINA